jgi:RNA polymerase sigma factor (sigma-70 family)
MNRLVSSNTRLCITHIRKPAARPGLDEEDQLQEAFLGLIRAAGKFEIDRGFKFSTYATRWIRQTISRAIADKALTIRLPVHVLDRMNKVRTARQELRRELRREPTDDEIRAATDVDPSDLVYPTRISRPLEPLDARADAIPDYETPEAIALENSAREEAASWLSRLDDRTADVLRRRYGIGQEEQTLQEVGDALRFTRERARQIESAGLKQLQELASSDVRRPPTRVPSARPPRPVHQPRRPNQFRFPDITRRSPARSDRDAPVDSGLRASNGIDWIPASARIEQVLRVHRRPKDSGPAEVTVQVLWTTKHTGYVRWTEGAAHVSVGNLVGMDAMAVAKFQRPVAEPGEALPDETAA